MMLPMSFIPYAGKNHNEYKNGVTGGVNKILATFYSVCCSRIYFHPF